MARSARTGVPGCTKSGRLTLFFALTTVIRVPFEASFQAYPVVFGLYVGFMFIAYNLRRIGNILIRDQLREYLRILVSLFLSKIHLSILKNSHFRTTFFRLSVWDMKFPRSLVPA